VGLIIRQPHTVAAQLRLQHATLFTEEVDPIALFAFEPAGQRARINGGGMTTTIFPIRMSSEFSATTGSRDDLLHHSHSLRPPDIGNGLVSNERMGADEEILIKRDLLSDL